MSEEESIVFYEGSRRYIPIDLQVPRSAPRVARDPVVDNRITLICEEKCCGSKNVIKQCHFSSGKRVKITCPGCFTVSQDLVYSPVADPQENFGLGAIEICSSDVVLDLSCHTLSQGNDLANIVGIKVMAGLQNVTITGGLGGAVYGFSQAGVRVEGGASEVKLQDLEVRENGHGGSFVSPAQSPNTDFPPFNGATLTGHFVGGIVVGNGYATGDDTIISPTSNVELIAHNITFKNVRAIKNWSCGAGVYNTDGLFIDDSSFSENYRDDPADAFPSEIFSYFNGGFNYEHLSFLDNPNANPANLTGEYGIRRVRINNSHFDKNVYNYPESTANGPFNLGFYGRISYDMHINNSTFNENFTNGNQSFGAIMLFNFGYVIENSTFSRNSLVVPNVKSGNYLYVSANCMGLWIAGGALVADGRVENTVDAVIRNCEFCNNTVVWNKEQQLNNVIATGLNTQYQQGLVVENCVSSGNLAKNFATKITATFDGFITTPDANTTLLTVTSVQGNDFIISDLSFTGQRMTFTTNAVNYATGPYLTQLTGELGGPGTYQLDNNIPQPLTNNIVATSGNYNTRSVGFNSNGRLTTEGVLQFAREVVFKNCKSLRNIVTTPIRPISVFSAGFTIVDAIIDHVLENCISNYNYQGFYFRSNSPARVLQSVTLDSCVAQNNVSDGLLVANAGVPVIPVEAFVLTNSLFNKNGRHGASFTNTPKTTITNNKFLNNTFIGLIIATPTDSYVAQNLAYKNATNYSGVGLPIVSGSVVAPPSLTGFELYNVSIV